MKKLLLLFLIPLAALAWWILQKRTEAPEVPFAKVKRETLISTLPTNGKVEPIEWAAVRVETAGLIEKVPVQEGQSVAKGAVLAQVSRTGLLADLSAAEAQVAQARAEMATLAQGGKSSELAEIESGLARARFNREGAQREYAALRRLAEKQAATKVEVDAARGKVMQAELEMEALERRRKALVTTADQGLAQARLKEAEAAVALARRRIEQGQIRSPVEGVVYNVAVRPGAYLSAGDLVANVGRLDKLRVRVYVDEPELGRIATGQPVTITWDALPGRKWSGSVERLPTAIAALGTRQVGEVLCTIENPDRELVPGTNINAEIRTNLVSNALTIPKEALRRESAGVGVLLLKTGKVAWQPVKIGASSVTRAQVTEGLSDGDSVALPTEHALKPGDAIKAVYP